MKRFLLVLPALLIFLALGFGHSTPVQGEDEYYQSSEQDEMYLLTPEELNDLLAPIALYPDPLIAQILPAATFIDQITDAADFVRRHGSSSSVDQQPWDVSVKAVAHYPDVLYMMAEKVDWTASLGQAFIDQQQDVMDAIQRLRAEASAQGNLYSTAEQQVIYEEDVVRIVPARPEYLYVPVYDPQVVYVQSYNPVYPFITFGAGFTIGAWLNRDCDWRQRRVFYHGWRGDGWVHRARPHIHDRRGIYINRRASVIHVNNRVLMHDNRRYRMELRNDAWRRRGLEPPPPRVIRQRPVIIEQRPARIEQPRPGRIERQGSGRIQRQAPGGIERQRPSGIDRSGPGRGGRSGPGGGDRRPRSELQQAPATGQQSPAVVVQPSTAAPQGQPSSRGRPERDQGPSQVVVPARPAVPPTTRPALPTTSRPALPPTATPAIPTTTRPAIPPTMSPALPPTTRPALPTTTRPAIPPTTRPAIPPTTRPAIAPISPSAATPAPRVVPSPSSGGRIERPSSPRFGGGTPADRSTGPSRR